MDTTVWIYARENSGYMWGNLGPYATLDKNLLIKTYGRSNLLCVLSNKPLLSDEELKSASKWRIKWGN